MTFGKYWLLKKVETKKGQLRKEMKIEKKLVIKRKKESNKVQKK